MQKRRIHLYLSAFYFPGEEAETDFLFGLKTTYDQTVYPYGVLPKVGLDEIFFRPITILYGGNGSGKSTALNVIAEKLRLFRNSAYNRSRFFEDYVDRCRATLEDTIPRESRIITSDDVFDMMLDIRFINEGIDRKREKLADEYYQLKRERFQIKSLDDLDHLHRINQARSKTKSRFIENESGRSLRERSNGESALMYFQSKIEMDTLCLLDEPENSLSPENQMILADFLADSVRYCGNQLVISTHSPFLLALPGAKIINLDDHSRVADNWAELKNPRVYFEFFKKHAQEFENRQ
ncbi:MAG: AAA family ATPase [Clostridia bacterium]|nr:AAA family ATPase [Clostridia bacterium]